MVMTLSLIRNIFEDDCNIYWCCLIKMMERMHLYYFYISIYLNRLLRYKILRMRELDDLQLKLRFCEGYYRDIVNGLL